MKITTFEYHAADGWTLEPTALSGFNLLVGISGAGKTRIVRAIEQVCAVATGNKSAEKQAERARGATFAIGFEHNDKIYRWKATLEKPVPEGSKEEGEAPLILSEQIVEADQLIVDRTPDYFKLRGHTSLRLDRKTSAIALLKEDPAMAALYVAFSRCLFQALSIFPTHGIQFPLGPAERQQYTSPEAVGADLDLPLHHKADYLAELFPAAFAEIEASFKDAFPLVERLVPYRYVPPGIDPTDSKAYNVALAAAESAVKNWVFYSQMSSGMQRYLAFLIHLTYAPSGTVVLIDELETSLGINCLPAATSFLLSRAKDLQLILTSHHPYIIEQIPTSCWKIVTRHGSNVRVLDPGKLPALAEGKTHLDRFTRLINLPEYDEWAKP